MLQVERETDGTRRPTVVRDLAAVNLANLTETPAIDAAVPGVLEALTVRDQERLRLTSELARLDTTPTIRSHRVADPATVEGEQVRMHNREARARVSQAERWLVRGFGVVRAGRMYLRWVPKLKSFRTVSLHICGRQSPPRR